MALARITMSDSVAARPHNEQRPAEGGDPADARLQPARSWWCRHPCACYSPPTGCRRVFFPFYGYLDADDEHRARVDRFFHVPMLVMALLVLPLLAIEWLQYHHDYSYVGQAILEHPAALIATSAAMVVIWLAFLVEFVIKISIAPSRLQYALKNWLDIVIIALPLLRPLRVAQVLRPARAARIFTLRGVVMKLLRTGAALVLGLEFARRLQTRSQKTPPATPIDYTQWSKTSLIAEIHRLQKLLGEGEPDRRVPEQQGSSPARSRDEAVRSRSSVR